jgi:hypothetical protein
MKVEEYGSNSRSGRIITSALVILTLLLGTLSVAIMPVSAAPVSIDPVPGTRTTYELNIEVDYFPGLLWPEVIDAFAFLESYFEARGINTTVDFNSTNNVITGEGNGYLTGYDMRTINRKYHDKPTTHIYFVIARVVEDKAGGAYPLWGPAIGLELANRYDLRFLVMHEFGHAIGIGLQDDNEDTEVYPSAGFMGTYSQNITEYRAVDWNSSFASEGSFGNQTWKLARMWNRYSIVGEIYDDTSDVMGIANGDITLTDSHGIEIVHQITLKEVVGSNEYSTSISPSDGTFTFESVKPGNYTLEPYDRLQLNAPVFVNVTERQIIDIGNIAMKLVPVEPPEPVESPMDNRMTYVLAAILVATILVLTFALWVRKNDKNEDRRNHKIMITVAIAAILLIVPSYFYLGPNDRYDAVTVNEFYDDMVDRNNNGTIGQEDIPLAWHSYGPGDRVVIRDRIDIIWFQPDENQTYIILLEYSGKYGEASPTNILVSGNVTDVYSKGDIIMVENRMIEYEGSVYPKFNGWTIVG